jgi:hypothetical protein
MATISRHDAGVAATQMSSKEDQPATTEESLRAEIESRYRAELDAQREELQRELSRKAFRIAELEEDMYKAAKIYESSISWRITKPVRAAKTLLARLRQS